MDRNDQMMAYLQGRLSASDRAAFEAALADDATLRAEVAALQAAARATGETRASADTRAEGWARLSASIADEGRPAPANTNRPVMLLKVASLAVAAVLVWETALTPLLSTREARFVPAGAVAEGAALRVAFAESARMTEVTALLSTLGATVEGGPSAIGLYTLSFDSVEARDTAEDALANRPALVLAVSRP